MHKIEFNGGIMIWNEMYLFQKQLQVKENNGFDLVDRMHWRDFLNWRKN